MDFFVVSANENYTIKPIVCHKDKWRRIMTDNQIQTNYYNRPVAAGLTGQNTTKTSKTNFSNLFQNAVGAASGQKPTDMDEIFQRAATQYGVPVNLLKAVAKAESGFDPDAVSSCGAQGVMQLMPSTAAALGVQNPLDAEQNIMGGAKYLSEMLARYNGSTTLALAAYNAGSGNVAKYGGVPPFKETQSYISKVMDYAGLSLDAPMDTTSSQNSLDSLNSLSSLSGSDSSTALNSLNMLSLLLGSSSSSTSLSALSSLLASSNSSANTAGLNTASGNGTSSDYISLLQLLIAQMQTNATQTMSSDLTDALSPDSSSSGSSSYGLL